ncbi:MAG: hypothetical protein M0037_10710 [Betaproteobacteria bacterium]|nr:hypothetical protein [Betaproteobacteria bacterium]
MRPGLAGRILLWGALAGVVAWSLELSSTPENGPLDGAIAHTARRIHATAAAPAPRAVGARPMPIRSRLDATAACDLFASQAVSLNPPPAAVASAPPPAPPALDVRYVGLWQSGGQTVFYLAAGTKVYGIQPGQALDEGWQLASGSSDALTFVYPPFKQTRVLRMGGSFAQNPHASLLARARE